MSGRSRERAPYRSKGTYTNTFGYIYTWYDSNPDKNGGNAGTPGHGTDKEDFING